MRSGTVPVETTGSGYGPGIHDDGTPAVKPLLVEGAGVRFGSATILSGVSLAIERGEIYGLLGPNGAGKSTLIRAISGRIPLSGGRIQIEGQTVSHRRAPSLRLGRVPQRLALFDHLTPRETLGTFASLFGLRGRAARERVARTLEEVGLQDVARRRADRLSGGMRQRLHIAVALLSDPSLLVLDEPTVGVDRASKEGLYELFLALRREGLGLLLITHDLPEARLLADRVGILIGGQLVAEGPPDDVIDRRFGGRRAVRVCARPPVPAPFDGLLQSFGLRRDPLGQEWTGIIDEEAVMPRLFEAIRGHSELIAEVTLTRPDLALLLEDFESTGQGEGRSDGQVIALERRFGAA